jgi:biopolymer transport protein TolQ
MNSLGTAASSAHAAAAQLDPWRLVMSASPVVKGVLVVLLMMSVGCWFIIGVKAGRIGRAMKRSRQFLELFWDTNPGSVWNVQRFEGIYGQLRALPGSPLTRVFHAGYLELARMSSAGSLAAGGDIHSVERALRRAVGTELTELENHLPFLATTGSTAPFIGLFGTVWGIMSSFIAIGSQHNAGLDVVAPGIAEALIATAIGLGAAIPAVMAYNYFVRRIQILQSEMDSFANDYLNIVRRYLFSHT